MILTKFNNNWNNVRFEIFKAVTVKNAILLTNRRFGGTYRLRPQGDKNQ
jgi:hypothetical protein